MLRFTPWFLTESEIKIALIRPIIINQLNGLNVKDYLFYFCCFSILNLKKFISLSNFGIEFFTQQRLFFLSLFHNAFLPWFLGDQSSIDSVIMR